MKINTKSIPFLILFLFINIKCLHLQQTESTQLQKLKQQQQLIRNQVNDMLSESDSVKSQLSATEDYSQKVHILESAINDQRQKIFELKNQIIYPFNESQTACKQLTDEQKKKLLTQIQTTRKRLYDLQTINNKFNQNLGQVQEIKDKIQKQFIILKQMENALTVNCKKNLSPTIFQSNLNSKNWILGPQTMKNLQDQYAKRAMIFNNITNCPLQTPFYSPSQQLCTQCTQPTPLFNMYAKQCSKCQIQEVFDADTKKCKPKPHYTNFTKVTNWNLGGGSLPTIDPKLTPCPDDTTYFNGIICVKCQLPSYWNVSSNSCKKCQSGFVFDLNTKKCQKVVPNQLTILQNTKWVTENITKVIEDRIKALKANQTTKNYQYCPSNTPYYDATICISCEYFNIDTKKCVSLPNGTQYNSNMRRFIAPETDKETNIMNTQKYTTSKPLTDTTLTNCNLTHPFFDGMACIQCQIPFDIYIVDDKKCASCNADEIYIQTNHTCQKRNKIFISDNFSRLLATPAVTVPAFKNSLLKKVNDNPESIISPCQNNEYSNFTACFTCKDNQYFNVQTLKCTICDGVYNQTAQTCKEKVYIFTNLKAVNITDMENKTIQDQTNRINEFLKTHKTSYVCPIDKPFAIDDMTCGTCPQLFSYTSKKCTQCPEFFIYLADERKCVQATMTVNFTNSNKILVTNNETLASFKQMEQEASNQNPKLTMICPGDRPYTQNRQFCFNCTQNSPYFNYTLKQCQNCPQNHVFDPKAVRCIQKYYITFFNNQTEPRMLGYDNYTLPTYKSELESYKKNYPYQNCTENEPFGELSGCKQCQGSTPFFDIRKKQCSSVQYLINFPKISTDYLIPADKNLDFYVSEEEKSRKESTELTTLCPADKPYTKDRSSCFICNTGEFFNLASRDCQKCPQGQSYSKQTKSCKQLFYITKFTSVTEQKMKGYPNYTLVAYKADQNQTKKSNPFIECPQKQPYGSLSGCVDCQQPTPYFDIKKKVCSSAKKLINFTAITTNYTLPEGQTISKYQNNENNFRTYSQSLTVECPANTPYTQNRDVCFACQDPNFLFNFETKQCQACPKGSKFISEKKRCLSVSYLTNINAESQIKMIGTPDYTIDNFKVDQANLKAQNPYENCPTSDPYGTVQGCRKCMPPEQYFDMKNKICTKVKRLINFDTTLGMITGEGKNITNYKDDELNYQKSVSQPIIVCPINLPFTLDHQTCFSCALPQVFNLQTKACQSCAEGETFDKTLKKCIKKQYYTLFTTATQKNILQTNKYTFDQYKADQNQVKSIPQSSSCTTDKPYATDNSCINCNSTNPYFNIQTKVCNACPVNMKFFETDHKCLIPVYATDLTNKNIKLTNNYTLDQAKAQQEAALTPDSVLIKCPLATPFAASTGCIVCNDSKAPYFNLKTKTCQGCREFYQYFQDNLCKDNIILTNTKQMMGYLEIDNHTKYNVEKSNNFTYLQNKHVVDCPSDKPFYNDVQCISCSNDKPIFDLKNKECIRVDSIRMSNITAMKFYIEKSDENLKEEQNEIAYLQAKNVKIDYCPAATPYLSGSTCIDCPENSKYFNIASQQCQGCNPGQICKQNTSVS